MSSIRGWEWIYFCFSRQRKSILVSLNLKMINQPETADVKYLPILSVLPILVLLIKYWSVSNVCNVAKDLGHNWHGVESAALSPQVKIYLFTSRSLYIKKTNMGRTDKLSMGPFSIQPWNTYKCFLKTSPYKG